MPRSHNAKRISYKSEDEKEYDRLGFVVAHDHFLRPKTIARMHRIRRVAAILFAEGGLNGISLQDVARAGKIAPASMHYYFGKRERLLHDILVHHMQALDKIAELTWATFHERDMEEAWLYNLTLEFLRVLTSTERAGHRVLIHTLHTLPQLEFNDIDHRLFNIRRGFAMAMGPLAGLMIDDPQLQGLIRSYLAMVGHTAIWFPATETPLVAAPELEAHAHLLTRMANEGLRALRETTTQAAA